MKRPGDLVLLVLGAISLFIAFSTPTASSAPLAPDADTEGTTSELLYLTFEQGRWGLIDARGKVVLPARYEQIAGRPDGLPPGVAMPPGPAVAVALSDATPISEQVIPVRLDGQAALALRDGRLLAKGTFQEFRGQVSEDRIAVRANGRFGFATGRGELTIPAIFDEVMSFRQGYAFVRTGNRWGVVDRNGQAVTDPTWDEVRVMDPADPLAAVRIGDQWGVVERSGKTVLPLRFDFVMRPVPPLIFGIDGGRPVYVREDGSVAFELKCPSGSKALGFPFFDQRAAVVSCGDRWGLVDPLGKFLLAPALDGIENFQQGLACVTSGGKSGVVDTAGQFVVPLTAGGPCEFSEGLASFRGSTGRLGFMDRTGSVVIAARFEGAGVFKDGIAPVIEAGKTGYIDRNGAWVIPPQFWKGSAFMGPLAAVALPVSSDTLEIRYVDRSGQTVYRVRLTGGFMFDKRTLLRFSEAAKP